MRRHLASMVVCCACVCLTEFSPALASDVWHVKAKPAALKQEISFANGGARLVGTAYLPENGDHLPAVIALHGASDATRSAALYRHLREGLPAMGIAVLIYDRRGSGESSASRKNTDYETLADDAIAGKNALGKLPRIDPKRIGFWGLSQGGWLAVLAAARDQGAAFAISVSAPLRKVKVPLLFIYGGEDPWIPVAQSIKQLDILSKQHENIRYAVVADASHEMMLLARETMAFDAKTMNENAPQAPGYFMLMASWLDRQVRH